MYLSERPLRESEQPRVCSMSGGKGAPKGAASVLWTTGFLVKKATQN